MSFTTTTKWALRKLAGGSLVNDIDAGFDALAEDIDPKLTPFDSGLLASRPTSTSVSPGKAGRTYRATDTGGVFLDTGTAWVALSLGVGEIRDWPTSTAPDGWLTMDGSQVSRTTYQTLFALLGTAYGAGNGSTTFHLPNASGRTTIGVGTATGAPGATAHALGDKDGEETHLLTTPEIPGHTHAPPVGSQFLARLTTGGDDINVASGTGLKIRYGSNETTSITGGSGAHQNMQPYLVLNKIIRAL